MLENANRRRGFTLIEVMVVIAIVAMIMAMGVPSLVHSMRKDGLRQAISDVIEACTTARSQAILYGLPAEVHFSPRDRTFNVAMSSLPDTGQFSTANLGQANPLPTGPKGPSFSAHLSEELIIEMLDVNFQEKKDEPEARVRFFPNGTSDEFTIVLQEPQRHQYRKITLDIISGTADVETIR
jgi:type II secretion system protein H